LFYKTCLIKIEVLSICLDSNFDKCDKGYEQYYITRRRHEDR